MNGDESFSHDEFFHDEFFHDEFFPDKVYRIGSHCATLTQWIPSVKWSHISHKSILELITWTVTINGIVPLGTEGLSEVMIRKWFIIKTYISL